MPTSVADCERVQTAWFRHRARELGRSIVSDGDAVWIPQPDALHLMFPRTISRGQVALGLAAAREHDLPLVGAWLGTEVDAAALEEAGFDRGWAPCWMARDIVPRRAAPSTDPGVRISVERVGPGRYAVATDPAGARVGGASALVDGNQLGVFDMWVDEGHRRRNVGTRLLEVLCSAGADDGAGEVLLNATPAGELLYSARGFRRIGEGITWWLHRETAL